MHDRRAIDDFTALDAQGQRCTVPAGVRLTRCEWWRGQSLELVWEFDWDGHRLCCEGSNMERATRLIPER